MPLNISNMNNGQVIANFLFKEKYSTALPLSAQRPIGFK